jgi:hypothetical protein
LDNVPAGADFADELIYGSGAELVQVTAQVAQPSVVDVMSVEALRVVALNRG